MANYIQCGQCDEFEILVIGDREFPCAKCSEDDYFERSREEE